MFTGIVEEVGRIITADRKGNSARLKIEAEKVLEDIKIGDSIAVNGICLTVTSFGKNYFTADVMHETLRRSSIGEAAAGSPGEPGTCDGGKQQIWRSYRDRTY